MMQQSPFWECIRKERKQNVKEISPSQFTAALFKLAKIWKQPK